MRRRSLRLALAALAAAALAPGCGPSSAGAGARDGGWLATQVPVDAVWDPLSLEPSGRYPEGSRVVLLPEGSDAGDPLLLSRGLAAAGAPRTPAGDGPILFAGRRQGDAHFAVFASDGRGGPPRAVLDLGRDCVDPAPLAGGAVVASCRDQGPEGTGGWSLYTAEPPHGAPRRITFSLGPASQPEPLADGRILFVLRHGPGPDAPASLFTVNPDGTLVSEFRGAHDGPRQMMRPRQAGTAAVLFLGRDHPEDDLRLHRVEMRRPAGPEAMVGSADGAAQGRAVTLAPVLVEPLPGGAVLVGARGAAAAAPVFSRLAAGGAEPLGLARAPGWLLTESAPAAARPRARRLPPTVDPDRPGLLVGYDAGRSDGVVGPPAAAPAPAMLEVEAWTGGAAAGATRLGTAAVEADGSFYVQVPPDTPLRVLTRDGAGGRIAVSGWFWVRPGEVRACFGCHESRHQAPVNRPVLALRQAPVAVGVPGPEGGR